MYGNRYKDADCEKLMEYANTLTAMIHARSMHIKGSHVGKKL